MRASARRTVLLLAAVLAVALWCSAAGAWPWSRQTVDPIPSAGLAPNLHLSFTYKDAALDVPPPAIIPDAFWKTKAARSWADRGDVRRGMKYAAADGTPYEIDLQAVIESRNGKRRPMIAKVRRYRADGTLAVESSFGDPETGRPADWTVYAADGKTPVLRTITRDRAYAKEHENPAIFEPTYYIWLVLLYDAAGKDEAMYHANYDGTIYVKEAVKWNGTGWAGTAVLEGASDGEKPDRPPATRKAE